MSRASICVTDKDEGKMRETQFDTVWMLAAAVLTLLLLARPAAAQTPPGPAELAAFRGLHAAAARGDAEEIRRLLAAGADPHARDPAGRTPLHVAAFRAQGDAIRALVKGGADINAQENDRYDIITIAAVADDVNGLRLGTPEICRRGMTADDMPRLARLVARALTSNDPEALADETAAMSADFDRLHFVL